MTKKFGVLLLHGLTGVPSEMRPVEKYLQKLGCETEAPTLAGHGGSNDELLNATWQQWIESAQQGLNRLAERVDHVVVCGLSMGGSIASILATNNEVAGVVLLSPTLSYDSPELSKPHLVLMRLAYRLQNIMSGIVAVFPIIGRLVYWTETPPYGLKDERLQRQITKAIEAAKSGKDTKFGLFRTYWISLWHMLRVTEKFRALAGRIGSPTLLISSLEDTLVSINNATAAYRSIGTSQKSLVMLTGCDHVLTLDLKRNYVCRLIGEFLEAIGGPSTAAGEEADIELTAELHNRLNPLGGADWSNLVPGAPSLANFAASLAERNMHESACHTLVFRYGNEPLLMVPLVIDTIRQSALIGVPESSWGRAPSRHAEPEHVAKAWKECYRICLALYESYKIKHVEHVESVPSRVPVTA